MMDYQKQSGEEDDYQKQVKMMDYQKQVKMMDYQTQSGEDDRLPKVVRWRW